MKKTIHLIPYDGTGGVEVAARSMRQVVSPGIDFSVQSVYPHVPAYGERHVTFGLRPLLDAFARTRAQSPDLLIVSLWRACIVGALVKLVRRRVRLVLMLHSTKDAHWLDKWVTRITAALADECWGDSLATLNDRVPALRRSDKEKRVISFVTRRLKALSGTALRPRFIFWGRLTAIKGLDRAIRMFAEVRRTHPSARFTIIGPDGGALADLQGLVASMGLQENVVFLGGMDMPEICLEAASACFYLQASHYEGMAMSVVEAMQLGLVPVVTPVGEIRNYCRDGENAIVIRSEPEAVEKVRQLLQDEHRYRALQRGATEAWLGAPLYAESMLEACRAALCKPEVVST